MEWISVNEKPKYKQYVLIYGKGGRTVAALYSEGKFLAYNPFNDELEECEEVTHWTPLLEPPKQ